MSIQNYYTAYYQAILDRNTSKLAELDLLFDGQENATVEYPNENPGLKYEDIFGEQDPEKFIRHFMRSTLKADKDFALKIEMLENPMASEEAITTRQVNYNKLLKYPLLNYCPNPSLGLNVLDTIASITYSEMFDRNDLSKLANLVYKSSIIADILTTMAIYINTKVEQGIIALIGEDSQNFDPTQEILNGYYSEQLDAVVITNQNEINLPTILHEFLHVIMYALFDRTFPVPYNSKEMKNMFHQALKDTLLNFIPIVKGNSVDSEIRNMKNTREIGEELAKSFFVIPTKKQEIEEEVALEANTNNEFVYTDIINTGKVLSIFLSLYLGVLDIDEETQKLDGEFIARLPEAIAIYEGNNIDFLSPIAIFWENYISPVILDYIELSNPSGICLPLIGTEKEFFKIILES